MKNSKYKILILEPSEIIRQGLVAILEQKTKPFLITQEGLESELPTLVRKTEPHLLVISPSIYNNNSKLIQQLQEQKGLLIIGLIFSFHHPDTLHHFDGLIYLNDKQETILATVNNLLKKPCLTQSPVTSDTLSERETEVLKLMVTGFRTKKIADILFISTHTVNAHRKNIMRKLDIKTISGLTIYAVLNNIINLKEA